MTYQVLKRPVLAAGWTPACAGATTESDNGIFSQALSLRLRDYNLRAILLLIRCRLQQVKHSIQTRVAAGKPTNKVLPFTAPWC